MYLNISNFIKENSEIKDFYELSKSFELEKHKTFNKSNEEGVFFTNNEIVNNMLKNIKHINKSEISILEPSVGSGNFIPYIIKYFADKYTKINLYINDIDSISIEFIKYMIKNNILKVPQNIKIIYLNKNFLIDDFSEIGKIDFIIGNPPYGKILDNNIKKSFENKKTNNMFSFFIERSIQISDNLIFIIPKSLLYVKQFAFNRKQLYDGIYKITDYGNKAFNVNLETISFCYSKGKYYNKVKIEDYINNVSKLIGKSYVMNNDFPIWLLYRDEFFDNVLSKLEINIFQVFRDRQITNKMLLNEGTIQVLKGKNIGIGSIININGYDQYVNDYTNLKSGYFYNKNNVLCLPNLTNNIRTCILPNNTIVNGAVALIYKNDFSIINDKTIDFINSEEFKKYFYIIKNKSNLSVNLDENIIYFFGDIK